MSTSWKKATSDAALNVLGVVGHTYWSADKRVISCIFRTFCAKVQNNVCIVYGSVSKLILRVLNAATRRLKHMSGRLSHLPCPDSLHQTEKISP